VVLTESGLSTIVRAVIISRQIVQRMKNYLIYRIACTVQILCFFFFSCLFISPSSYHQEQAAGEPAWPVFFDLPVMSVVIITILNDGTIISIAYDRVRASRLPEVWNMRAITLVSMVIGVIAMASSMLLLHQCLRSNQINSVMHMFGVPFLSYGEIQVSCEQLHMYGVLGVFEERRLSVLSPLICDMCKCRWPSSSKSLSPTSCLSSRHAQPATAGSASQARSCQCALSAR
jgi:magnesium-transporting ATPase (P-type)